MAIPAFLRKTRMKSPDYRNKRNKPYLPFIWNVKIILYREMGLENSEIGKLLDLGKKALELRLRKLFDLGLLQHRQTSHKLALFS
ncbi:hypothetical protein [Rodentibacter sp. Ppn85]|uniref:hypothetical protein n=1 Tax=Rodentibacter sp. Ppn85 TaxID=1908525 RepID=UPI00117A0F6F|nr:hypothetical protein [Rodentibacter sp. Ppn85]